MKWVSVALPRPIDKLFLYEVPTELEGQVSVGSAVAVPFGKSRSQHGFVVEEDSTPGLRERSGMNDFKLKPIERVIDQDAVSADILKTCRWAADYYLSPLGEVLDCAMPKAALGLKAKKARKQKPEDLPPAPLIVLSEAQNEAVQKIRDSQKVFLLEGVTGSGKTEVYLEIAKEQLDQGKSVLLLVPEIALTAQLRERFEARLGQKVGLWHSAVSDGKRRELFLAIREGSVRVVVGARSAIFAPLQDLGLIVVDEEHDSTYKQDDRVRYHARDLAVVRAKALGAKIILGSATPSMESLERVREERYDFYKLKSRAGNSQLPVIEVVDLRDTEKLEGLQATFASHTLDVIRSTLQQGEQVLIYLNRRGYAAFLLCEDCGAVCECPNCSVSLTYHLRSRELRCHQCGHFEGAPDQCVKCQSSLLKPQGAGTESLEVELPRLIPEMKAARIDRDQMTSQTRLEAALKDFREGKTNTLVGTQMLAKGHDFPGVTLVVVVLADALFRWPDFRATERALQTLIQVSGRAGRREIQGRVLIQTFDPEHPVLEVLQGNVELSDVLQNERELRQALAYPPFARLAKIRFEGTDSGEVEKAASLISERLRTHSGIEVLGPSPGLIERVAGIYRWNVLIKSKEIQRLRTALWEAKQRMTADSVRFYIDVDPYSVD